MSSPPAESPSTVIRPDHPPDYLHEFHRGGVQITSCTCRVKTKPPESTVIDEPRFASYCLFNSCTGRDPVSESAPAYPADYSNWKGAGFFAMESIANTKFRPALIVVDMQEDFCPPDGSLAVEGGRTIAPLINGLLSRSGFVVKIATQDFHPPNHISFASNHSAPNNKPFESYIELRNPTPGKETETKPQRLWPTHCVQDSHGASIIPEIDAHKIDVFVLKGMDEKVEMYSAFADAFGSKNCVQTGGANVDLKEELKSRDVTDVFIVGIAGEYCVKYTALDAAECNFKVWVIEEGVKSVDPGVEWENAKDEMANRGVVVINADAPELERIEL